MDRISKCVLFLFILFMAPKAAIASNATNSANSSANFDWAPVINAIIEVESGGNPNARSGRSVGAMQITPIMVAECNQILKKRGSKKRYTLADRLSVAKSKEMFLLFQSFHNPLNSIEQAIRSWNGGMHFSVKRTQRYFERVMLAMN